MFVLTAKLSKSKLLAAGVILIAAIVLIVLLATSVGTPTGNTLPSGASNDDRVAYLATFGWSVNAQPKEAQKIRIPETQDNQVFARYNDLQRSQGFDLAEYAGKEAMRYVYEVLNYPNAKSPVYASVLVYDGHIIGGDITDSAPDGIIHGFAAPSGVTENESSDKSSAPLASSEPSEPSDSTPSSTEASECSESSTTGSSSTDTNGASDAN